MGIDPHRLHLGQSTLVRFDGSFRSVQVSDLIVAPTSEPRFASLMSKFGEIDTRKTQVESRL